MTSERLTLDAHGRSFVADLTLPPAGTGPGLVVVHEWWGLHDGIRPMGARFAAEGFVVSRRDRSRTRAPSDRGSQRRRCRVGPYGAMRSTRQ